MDGKVDGTCTGTRRKSMGLWRSSRAAKPTAVRRGEIGADAVIYGASVPGRYRFPRRRAQASYLADARRGCKKNIRSDSFSARCVIQFAQQSAYRSHFALGLVTLTDATDARRSENHASVEREPPAALTALQIDDVSDFEFLSTAGDCSRVASRVLAQWKVACAQRHCEASGVSERPQVASGPRGQSLPQRPATENTGLRNHCELPRPGFCVPGVPHGIR